MQLEAFTTEKRKRTIHETKLCTSMHETASANQSTQKNGLPNTLIRKGNTRGYKFIVKKIKINLR